MSRRHLRLAGLAFVGIALAAITVSLLAGGLRVLHAQSDLPRVPHIDGAPLRPRMELTSPNLGQQAADRPGPFPFQTATSSDGMIIVHYYYRSAAYGAGFVSAAQQAVQTRVQPRLGYGLKSPVNIYVYNSRGDFLAGVQPRIRRLRAPSRTSTPPRSISQTTPALTSQVSCRTN